MDDKQKELIFEAIRVHDETTKLSEKILSYCNQSVSESDDILFQQIKIILKIK